MKSVEREEFVTDQSYRGTLDEEKESEKSQYFRELNTWLMKDMIELNNADITSSSHVVGQFQNAATRFVSEFPALTNINSNDARKAIQGLGFIISSLERHMQARGFEAGEGLASVDGARDLFLTLSEMSGHPPRDSLYTFSLWNTGDSVITFSGNPQENYSLML